MKKDMGAIEQRFLKFLRKNPFCSTYLCYAAAIAGRGVPVNLDLIDQPDYDIRFKELYLGTLEYLTKNPRKIEGSEIDLYEKNHLRVFPCLSQIPQLKKIKNT